MKYQLTCPNCHYEFTYDKGYYDKEIARLGIEIQDIIMQLAQHNMLPKTEQRMRTDWWLRAKKSLSEKQKELAELKAVRKMCDEQLDRHVNWNFKNIVKEKFGLKVYKEILNEAIAREEAYKISDMRKHEYSAGNKKQNIVSVNKL